MKDSQLEEPVKTALAGPNVRLGWDDTHGSKDTERFNELAMDRIFKYLDASPGSLVLDAGCGTGVHSIRLARRGLRCLAVDFSPMRLTKAELNIRKQQLEQRITIKHQNITSMTLENDSVDHVFCWTVLMHIPDLKKAVAELCRVLKPGGRIVIGENNMYSVEGILRRICGRLSTNKLSNRRLPFGIEYWIEIAEGPFLYRMADIDRIVELLKENGVAVEKRFAYEFTEIYTRLPWPALQKVVLMWNEFWFRFVRLPSLAYGNVLLGRKL